MPGYFAELGQVESCRGANGVTPVCVALTTNCGAELKYNFTAMETVLTAAAVVGSVAAMAMVASAGLAVRPLGLIETVNEVLSVVPVRGPLTCTHDAAAGGVTVRPGSLVNPSS